MNLNPSLKLASALALALLNAVFVSTAVARPADDPAEDSSLSIKVTREPVFPLRLQSEGYTAGAATLQIVVDQFGELRDALLIEATHPDFGKSVIDVIYKWEFSVPRINGEPVSMVQDLRVNFESNGNVFSYYTGADIGPMALFERMTRTKTNYQIAKIDEIDSIPVPVHLEKPLFPVEMLKGETIQRAVFEFYIDELGNVRIPTLREDESSEDIEETLLVITQDALMQWKFQPPTRNGKPVVVRVAQPITFTNSTSLIANTP